MSRRGGKAESLRKSNGQFETHEASDQQEGDKSVRALLETQRMKYPIALLVDDKYALFPYDLASRGCAYAVLGWYYIVHAWGLLFSSLFQIKAMSDVPTQLNINMRITLRGGLSGTNLRSDGVKAKVNRGGWLIILSLVSANTVDVTWYI